MAKIDWSDVDWSLPNAVIGEQKGCSQSLVKSARGYLAPSTTRDYTEYDWSDVDWAMPDAEIMRLKKAKSTTVWAARRRLAPETVFPHSRTVLDWEELDWSLSNAELALLTGKNTVQISAKRKALGKPPAPRSTRSLEGMKKFEIFLSLATEKKLRDLAREENLSFGLLVQELIEEGLSRRKAERKLTSFRALMASLDAPHEKPAENQGEKGNDDDR